jgi:hypothetical protein
MGKSDAAKIAKKLAGSLSPETAEKILAKYDNVDAATKLVGAERKEYLDALDTVYGDRSKRAKDLGFGDKTYYHGSHRDIKEFKPDKGSPEGFMGKSVYLTNDPADASWNYASPEGPDIKNKIERLAERYQNEKDMNYTAAQEKAYKKVIGRVDSGAVYPVKTRASKTADLDSRNQWIDLNPEYDEAGELVSENPIAKRIAEGIQQRAKDAESRLEGERILSDVDLYDEKTPRELYENVRQAAGKREISDKTGGLLNQEFARGALEDSGFDSARVNAHNEFNMDNTTPDTEHLMVFDPAKIRSTSAAFDPRFKDSANILALNGSQAPKIAAGMLKPKFSLGDAFDSVMEPLDAIDKPVNQAVSAVSDKLLQQTNLVPKNAQSDVTNYAENVRRQGLDTALNFAVPKPSDVLMGGGAKLFKVAGQGGSVANKMLKAAEPVDTRTAAEMYRDAKAGLKKSLGVVNVPSAADKVAAKGFGKVTVVDKAPVSGTINTASGSAVRTLPINNSGSGI